MLQAALAAGVSAAGGDALLGGVLPTPAAPLLIGRYGFDLAVVLSASHNPYQDNGIKFFAGDGYKLSDETELAIERELEQPATAQPAARRAIGRVRELRGARRGLPARAARALRRARSGRPGRAARLRQRRHLPGRAGDLPAPGREGDGARRRARRAQHQRRLRLDARRAARRAGARAAGTRSASPSTATATACWPSTATGAVVDGDELMALAALHLREQRAPERRRRGGDGDDQLRLSRGDGARGRRGGDHEGRRPLRARGAARARLDARRRAVRPHHRDGLQPHGRRDRQRAADARGARRPRPGRARRDGEAAAAARQRARARPRRAASARTERRRRRCAPRTRRWRGAGACSCARAAPSRWCG